MSLRYVDDTFILWSHLENVQTLLDHVKYRDEYNMGTNYQKVELENRIMSSGKKSYIVVIIIVM